ncbi:hypothetical protein [Sorangium sp. So ce1078]|uniref:monooxygenase n=1 Tax=Sorangium sp. So ce1078 TaxID=3133329 RepID=UPI003F630BCE
MTRCNKASLAAPLMIWALAACGGDGHKDTSAGAGGRGASSSVGTGAGPESYSVAFDPITVQPGVERTQCVIRSLDNAEAKKIGRIRNELPAGSHHLVVYRTNDVEERPEPFDCSPFSDIGDPTKGSPLMIAQRPEETLEFPDGIGISIQPRQMIRLEMHYVNATPEPIEVSATTTLVAMAGDSFEHEADFLYFGNFDVHVDPRSTATLGPVFIRPPDGLGDVKYFGVTGHTHRWGTNVLVTASPGPDGPETPVYDVERWSWSEPATVYHDPPFQLDPGGGFNLTCTWNNLSDRRVDYGGTASDEMCFFWTYYYPSQGAYVCFHSEAFGGARYCCPGMAECDLQ